MPADPDLPSWLSSVMALFGAGGGYKLVTHEGRIKSLESARSAHTEKLEDIGQKVARIDERSVRAEKDREAMIAKLDHLIGRRVD